MVCMSVFDSPQSEPKRRRPARWADLRFVLGIVLIVASVVGVWAVVAVARQTTPVLAAAHTIVPGDRVTADDFAVVDVALGRTAETYVRSGADLSGRVADRTIPAGELVPHDALVTARSRATTTVVVESTADVPASIRPGSTVDVWAAEPEEQHSYGTPKILVSDAVVAKVAKDDSMLGGGSASLELVIPRADVADTLAAIAADWAVSVVPTGGAECRS